MNRLATFARVAGIVTVSMFVVLVTRAPSTRDALPAETATSTPNSDQPVHTSHRGHLRRVLVLGEVALVELLVELPVAGLLGLAVVASLMVPLFSPAPREPATCLLAAADFALAGCCHRG